MAFVFATVACIYCGEWTTRLAPICSACGPAQRPECMSELQGEALEDHEARILHYQRRAESGLPLFRERP